MIDNEITKEPETIHPFPVSDSLAVFTKSPDVDDGVSDSLRGETVILNKNGKK